MEYTVIYVIQVDAESELEAAKTADKFMKAQTDPHCLVAAGSQLGDEVFALARDSYMASDIDFLCIDEEE